MFTGTKPNVFLMVAAILLTAATVIAFWRTGESSDFDENHNHQGYKVIVMGINNSIKNLEKCEQLCPTQELNCTELDHCVFHYPDYCDGVQVVCHIPLSLKALFGCLLLITGILGMTSCVFLYWIAQKILASSNTRQMKIIHAMEVVADEKLLDSISTHVPHAIVFKSANKGETKTPSMKVELV